MLTLVITGVLMLKLHFTGGFGMFLTMMVGGIVCTALAASGAVVEGVRRALLGTASTGLLGSPSTPLLLLALALGTALIALAAPRLFRIGIDRAREKGYLDRSTAS